MSIDFRNVFRVGIFLIGSVPLQAKTHNPQAFLQQITGSPNEGQQIVEHYCAACHAAHPLIPLGAPRIGVAKDWQWRLHQGYDTLFKHTVEGYNAMPARGGCFECTDQQLQLAIAQLLKGEHHAKKGIYHLHQSSHSQRARHRDWKM